MKKDAFEDFKRELKQRSDLVSVASKYVQLERKGRYYWCRCPFHGEKTPSLCINDVDGMFYCYGCHVGGDVIKFVMLIESLSFVEAVELLAEQANLDVPEMTSKSKDDIAYQKKRKETLCSIMRDSAKHYYDNLSRPESKVALEYLEKRKLTPNEIKRFGLGYSIGFNDLPDFLKGKGYSIQDMLAVGVVKEKNGRVFDPLANRVIYPIIDIYGNVIAFGGRTLDPHPDFAKYLNTAETELFNKRNTLYGINILKKQRQVGAIPYVIVVEGYMDAIALQKSGFTMTVASMGTSLTESQAKMIKRFSDKVYICYDGDSAGQNATLRGLDILKSNGLNVMVVELPDKFDPDDVIKTYGKEGYQKLLDKALPLVEFKIKYLKNKYDVSSVDGRVKFLNEAIAVLKTLDSVERELYVPLVSEISRADAEFIKKETNKAIDGDSIGTDIEKKYSKQINVSIPKVEIQEDENNVMVKSEKYILYAMLHKKPYAYFKTDVSYLFSGKRKEVYKSICEILNEDPGANLIEEIYNKFPEDEQWIVAELINFGSQSKEEDKNSSQYYKDCVARIYKFYLENRQNEIVEELEDITISEQRRSELKGELLKINNDKNNKNKVEEL